MYNILNCVYLSTFQRGDFWNKVQDSLVAVWKSMKETLEIDNNAVSNAVNHNNKTPNTCIFIICLFIF